MIELESSREIQRELLRMKLHVDEFGAKRELRENPRKMRMQMNTPERRRQRQDCEERGHSRLNGAGVQPINTRSASATRGLQAPLVADKIEIRQSDSHRVNLKAYAIAVCSGHWIMWVNRVRSLPFFRGQRIPRHWDRQ